MMTFGTYKLYIARFRSSQYFNPVVLQTPFELEKKTSFNCDAYFQFSNSPDKLTFILCELSHLLLLCVFFSSFSKVWVILKVLQWKQNLAYWYHAQWKPYYPLLVPLYFYAVFIYLVAYVAFYTPIVLLMSFPIHYFLHEMDHGLKYQMKRL